MELATIQGGDGLPAEPDWLSIYTDEMDIGAAREMWGITVRELRDRGVLSLDNGHDIKRLIDFKVQYDRAARHVAEHGAILPAKRAKIGQFNPYWAVMKHADESIRAIQAELGIPPIRRGKATKVERGKKPIRAADAFLKPARAG